jgi:dipeptidyl aminopeptidase/acylaminoacyl peptidase
LTLSGGSEEGRGTWSPDGQRIAFHSNVNGDFEVFSARVDGIGGWVQLTDNQVTDGAPDWSPDGTRIAFTGSQDGDGEIYVMNADGSNVVQLTHNTMHDTHPAWSPDGSRIAFLSSLDGSFKVYAMNTDGSGLAKVVDIPYVDGLDWQPLPTGLTPCAVEIASAGWIVTNAGDRATFAGKAKETSTGADSGQEQYADHGPASPMAVRSLNVQAITCNAAKTKANIFGKATIDGSGSYNYRIDVQDLAEPGKLNDTYRMRLGTGYDSGERKLQAGNVQIR